MNMFKKRGKAAKEQDDVLVPLEAAPSKSSRGLTRKKKKQEVVEAPVFDLNAALPSSNDFRTSLLMPNLSARFSMLREQDDPNSKIGKASDDSVLFPKRASRIMLFNHNPLTDIAEVESIRSSFRPPFADERNASVSDGYASDDGGSIMNRSRPGEGNNLFGGRQKMYKVTGGSSYNLTAGTGLTGGKHLYESDVSASSYQQMRMKEKEEQARQRDLADRTSYYPNDEEQDLAKSPLTAFSRNRGTQSSTNSAPSNRPSSTAATSMTSDSPIIQPVMSGPVGKVKDLDANSSAESIGFAHSPSLKKIREEGRQPSLRLSGTKSAMNIRGDYTRHSPVPQVFRAMSPQLQTGGQQLDFALGERSSSPRGVTASPTQQESSDPLAHNVKPNDRGKATAMGMFNRPVQHYDDEQFQRRQMQMHEGRMSPLSTTSRAASRASPEPLNLSRHTPDGAYTRDRDSETLPQLPPIPDYPPSPVSNQRVSASSTGRASFSRPRAKSTVSVKEQSVKARVESLIRKQNAELAALEHNHLGPTRPDTIVSDSDKNGTFFNNSDDSDNEIHSRRPSTKSLLSTAPQPPPPSGVHPALRQSGHEFDFGIAGDRPPLPRDSKYSVASNTLRPSTIHSQKSGHESMMSIEDVDSPTLPTGLGLSGLIRTHLRQDSDKSSMLPPPSPGRSFADMHRASVLSNAQTTSESVKSDPFEYDRQPLEAPPVSVEPATPTITMSSRAQQMLEQAKALRAAADNEDAKIETNVDRSQDHPVGSPNHQRNASTETQREMQRFDEELAARRKRVEEGLKSVAERSRSRSPIGDRNGFLPKLAGRSNTNDRFEQPFHPKAMKMLGLTQKDQPSPRMAQESEDRSRNMTRQGINSRPGRHTPGEHDHQNGRQTPSGRHTPRMGTPHNQYPQPRSTTPSGRSNRSRSNSAVDRTTSRNKQIPEFDASKMPTSPYPSESFQDRAHRANSPGTQYDRSTSSAASHYQRPVDFRTLVPPGPADLARSRPSPQPNTSSESFKSFASPLPSPNPSASMTSLASGRQTPNQSGRTTPSSNRKRSITKHMISEPTFVSSTSTVPLVHLPRDGGPSPEPIPPPLPTMNPRRRNTDNIDAAFDPHPGVRPTGNMTPESPGMASPRSMGRLRKVSSEGGTMASKARIQALTAEIAREQNQNQNYAMPTMNIPRSRTQPLDVGGRGKYDGMF